LSDSYISVIEAVKHAAWFHHVKPVMQWIDSEEFEREPKKIQELSAYDGIIVPGGFGTRGIEGIISAIQFAREHRIPYLGLCYGMQLACVEFARHVMHKKDANTMEINEKTPHPIIIVNPHQAMNIKENRYGGTMRLGAYTAQLTKGSIVAKAYGALKISERHRHRYEFNNDYRAAMNAAGLLTTGINPETDLVEFIELPDHPFFVGTQAHPDFKSRPMRPHPLFREFLNAARKKK
jgi:CTP synthase